MNNLQIWTDQKNTNKISQTISVNKYLLRVRYVPGTILCTCDISAHKPGKGHFYQEKIGTKLWIKYINIFCIKS